jgi:hypothetical protein
MSEKLAWLYHGLCLIISSLVFTGTAYLLARHAIPDAIEATRQCTGWTDECAFDVGLRWLAVPFAFWAMAELGGVFGTCLKRFKRAWKSRH